MASSWESRVAEYVDSPDMTHRRRRGSVVTARIAGRYGNYSVEWDLDDGEGSCTCPSDDDPCKHAVALWRTWEANPGSFAGEAPAPAGVLFPAERLVFGEEGGYTWRCLCRKVSPQVWEDEEDALEAAAEHVQDHASPGGLTPEELRRAVEDLEEAEQGDLVRRVAARALQRFRLGLHADMEEAASSTSRHFGLEGEGHYESSDVGKAFAILERTDPDHDTLFDWKRAGPPAPLAEVLRAMGLWDGNVPAMESRNRCAGCGGYLSRRDAPECWRISGQLVHARWDCLNRVYGPDDPTILAIEELLGNPEALREALGQET
ncbi:MAG: SWIM zinc finger family protein [Thermoplasmatota archaeon]